MGAQSSSNNKRGTEAMMKTHYDERGKSPFLFENTQWWVVDRSCVAGVYYGIILSTVVGGSSDEDDDKE